MAKKLDDQNIRVTETDGGLWTVLTGTRLHEILLPEVKAGYSTPVVAVEVIRSNDWGPPPPPPTTFLEGEYERLRLRVLRRGL